MPQVETKTSDKQFKLEEATMGVFKFNIIPTEEFIKRESFKQAVNNCELCGAPVEFSYRQDSEICVLAEEAKCPVCAKERETSHHRVH